MRSTCKFTTLRAINQEKHRSSVPSIAGLLLLNRSQCALPQIPVPVGGGVLIGARLAWDVVDLFNALLTDGYRVER